MSKTDNFHKKLNDLGVSNPEIAQAEPQINKVNQLLESVDYESNQSIKETFDKISSELENMLN